MSHSAAPRALDPTNASLSLVLPADRMERVEGWARSRACVSTVYRPTTVKQIRDVFAVARRHGVSVCARGAGRSYGDASLGAEQITLDLSRMTRILAYDPQTGVIECEPGVSLERLWEYGIGDGWWPPVVSGTMHTSIGGAVAMNIHGKNNVRAGTFGEWVSEFDLLTTDGGSPRTLRRDDPADRELFHAVVGGMGLLGIVTRVRLQLRPIHGGRVRVVRRAAANLAEMFAMLDAGAPTADHAVGWVDAFARGAALGRGLVETVFEAGQTDEAQPAQTLRADAQRLPDTIAGIVPKSVLWRVLRGLFNDAGMRLLNNTQYTLGKLADGKAMTETHAGAAFKLDFVPDWKRAYGPHGLLQFQTCVPKETALATLTQQLETCHRHRLVPYLAVLKRHRPDDAYLLSYLSDGYSLAMDFKITRKNRARLIALYDEMAAFTLEGGGRFYFAKDGFLRPERMADFRQSHRVKRFLEFKRQLDPENLLQSDLYRRLFLATGDESPP